MRSLLLFLVIIIVAPSALLLPHLGVLLWSWISIMNPHRMSWGIANNFPLVLISATITLAAWFFSKEPKMLPSRFLVWIAFAFVIHTTITSFTALHPDHSWPIWDRTFKAFILFFATAALINSKVRIQALLWIFGISFGFFATIGTIDAISSGGHSGLTGPARSGLTDNNDMALALVISMPILNYLRMSSANKLVRLAIVIVLCFTLVAVISSYSRGALIALAAAGALFLKNAKGGVLIVLALVVVGSVVVKSMPERWTDRVATMESVDSIKEDGSFSGRLDAWYVSYRVAKSRPLTGGGFSSVELLPTFAQYIPEAARGRAAHSIYFQVLGDHGFIGLILYLCMPTAAWLHLRRTRRRARSCPQMYWADQLARMLQISIFCFLVGGAALSYAYQDFVLLLFVVSMNLDIITEKEAAPVEAVRYDNESPIQASNAMRIQ